MAPAVTDLRCPFVLQFVNQSIGGVQQCTEWTMCREKGSSPWIRRSNLFAVQTANFNPQISQVTKITRNRSRVIFVQIWDCPPHATAQ